MGHKRTRNRIPALPEAVKNLLALYSLEAWAAKQEEFPRGARSWSWRITKAGDHHIPGRVLFTVRGNPPLDHWMTKVQQWTDGVLDFASNFGGVSGVWYDELTDQMCVDIKNISGMRSFYGRK